MLEKIDAFIDSKRDEMIKTLKDFINIPSLKSEPEGSMPYGKKVYEALNFIGKKAEEKGFETENFENKIISASLGCGEDKLGILCHTDVVCVNKEKWDTDPFDAVVKDNLIFGRGALDNKGPTIASLYALYAIKECGIKLNNKVKLFFGSDEENGMHDFKDYIKTNSLPEYGFAPDCCFPVGYSETGKFDICGEIKYESENIKSVSAGGAFLNVIPETATAEIKNHTSEEIEDKISKIKDVKYKTENLSDSVKLTVYGKSTHSAHPHWGINPLTALLEVLSSIEGKDSIFGKISRLFPHGMFFAENFGLNQEKAVLSLLAFEYKSGIVSFSANCRVNAKENSLKISEQIIKGFTVPAKISNLSEPHYVSEESFIVKELCKVYKEFTGREDAPYAADGATYAHIKDSYVAFGGVLYGDGSEEAHGNNECYNTDTLIAAAKMIARAVISICEGEN